MKFRIFALIVFVPLIYWQLDLAFNKYSKNKALKQSRKVDQNYKKKGAKRSTRSYRNREFSSLASVKNEYADLMIPMTIDDLRVDDLADEENGAFYLKEAFGILKTKDKSSSIFKIKALSQKSFEKLSDKEKESLRELLNDPDVLHLFTLCEDASKQESFNWGLKYEDGFSMILPHLTDSRVLHKLQNLKVDFLLSEGDKEGAAAAIEIGLKTAAMSSDGYTIIGELVQFWNVSHMAKNLSELDFNKGIYDALTNELYSSHGRQLSTLDGERIIGGENAFEKIRNADHEELLKGLDLDDANAVLKLSPEALDKDHAYYLKTMLSMRQLVEDPTSDTLRSFEEIGKEVNENKYDYPLTSLILPGLEPAFKKYYSYQTSLKLNIISMKLKQYQNEHGQYPDSLEKLSLETEITTETLDGGSFLYSDENGTVKLSSKTDFGKASKGLQMSVTLD